MTRMKTSDRTICTAESAFSRRLTVDMVTRYSSLIHHNVQLELQNSVRHFLPIGTPQIA